jgi:hypothetical protein
MKIAPLFSGESPMSWVLTTTHENGIFRGVSARYFDTHRAAPFASQRMHSNSVQKSMQG